MNIFTLQTATATRLWAVATAFAMILSALPVHFFVAEAIVGNVERVSDNAVFVDLQTAHDDSGTLAGDTLMLLNDVTTSAQVTITKGITIDGDGYTIEPQFSETNNSNNSGIGITNASDVTIEDIVIEGSGGTDLHGINIFNSTGVQINDVESKNNDFSAVNIAGSEVVIDSITTSGNGVGTLYNVINAAKGTATNQEATLEIQGDSKHEEDPAGKIHVVVSTDSSPNLTDTDNQYQDITALVNLQLGLLNLDPLPDNTRAYTLKPKMTEVIEVCKEDSEGTPVAGWGMTLTNGDTSFKLETEGKDGCVTQEVDPQDGPWTVFEEIREDWTLDEILVENGTVYEGEGQGCQFFGRKLIDVEQALSANVAQFEQTCLTGRCPNPEPKVYSCTFVNEEIPQEPVCEIGDNLLLNASFEEPAVKGDWSLFDTIPNWSSNISTDGIELQNGLFGGASDGEQHAELDVKESTELTQNVALIPGATYELRFDFKARSQNEADNSIEATADGDVLVSTSTDNTEWTTYSSTFVADDGSVDITFADKGTSNGTGTLLDNAVLCLVEKPAPKCEVEIVSNTSDFVVEKNAAAKALSFIHPAWDAVIPGATWIWGDDPVVDPANEETQTFLKQFGFEGNVLSATLYVASDNDHSASLNGNPSNDGGSSFGSAVSYDVTGEILQGNNDLEIAVTNLAANANPRKNPAGLLYKLHIEGEVTGDEDCSIPYEEEPDPITVVAHKIVCTDESELPNWGNGGDNITAETAADWVEKYDSCSFEEGWDFQWGPKNAYDPGDTLIGEADDPWTTFGPTDENGEAMTSIPLGDVEEGKHLWFREVLQEGYIPFTHGPEGKKNTDDFTAEVYCHTDVRNYDNYDRIDTIAEGETYYCVAWNHEAPEPLVCEPGVNLIANGGFEAPVVDGAWDIFDLATYPALGWMVDFVDTFDGAPEVASLELQRNVSGWLPSEGNQYAELDSDWDGPGGTSGDPASVIITQEIPTIPGEEYKLSWDFSARPNTNQPENDLEVFVDGAQVANNTAAGGSQTDWSSESYYFTATEDVTTIAFADDGDANSRGTFLDNVKLSCDPGPQYGPYCGDGEKNQDWETCDGDEGCTEYCQFENQCYDEQLVKITLDPQAPESESFAGIFLGHWNNPIPSGVWFNFDELDTKTAQKIAKKSDGLGVERTENGLVLAVEGDNRRQDFDYAFGTVEVMGLDMGSTDRSPVPGWPLEDDGDYVDVFEKDGNELEFKFWLTTGNDAASVELVPTGEYGQCGGGTPDDEELYRIFGKVWHDDNENQDREEAEENLEGWKVSITNGEDTFHALTDEFGNYEFFVPAGTWTITETEEAGWVRTTQESYTVTVPEFGADVTLGEKIKNFFIPVAYAQEALSQVIEYGSYDFGNNEGKPNRTSRSGGGGGGGSSDDPDESEDLPEGEVLGEQVSIVPLGAADAGAGGTAPAHTSLKLFALAAIRTRKTNVV